MYSPKEYWDGIERRFGSADRDDFAAVIHPDSPPWFNILKDRIQHRAWILGLEKAAIPSGSTVLDLGCGTGRWIRRYVQRGMSPVGLDATDGMLRRAAARGSASSLTLGHIQELPFRDATFDLVSDVTVIQHVQTRDHQQILSEMARVLRPDGYVLLIELIRGNAPHIFPRRATDWSDAANAAGLTQIYARGVEYFLMDRAFVGFVQMLRRATGIAGKPVLPGQSKSGSAQQKPFNRKIFWALRRITCAVSEILEPAAQTMLPVQWATHALMVFKKTVHPHSPK